MCKLWNQAGRKAAAGADSCDVDVKQTGSDRRDVCMFVPVLLSSGRFKNKIYTVVLTQNGYGFLNLLRLLYKSYIQVQVLPS